MNESNVRKPGYHWAEKLNEPAMEKELEEQAKELLADGDEHYKINAIAGMIEQLTRNEAITSELMSALKALEPFAREVINRHGYSELIYVFNWQQLTLTQMKNIVAAITKAEQLKPSSEKP